MIKNKKAQHEMVGFVLIVIIVSIIGLIFLVLFVNKSSNSQSDLMSNLLQATMYYTTDCYSTNNEPREVEVLITDCDKDSNKKCLDGRLVCDALDANLKKALDESLKPGKEFKNKAYNLSIYFRGITNRAPVRMISDINKGIFTNCGSVEGGSHIVTLGTYSSGVISVDLLVCKASEADSVKEASDGSFNE
ncbi:hypothetical protein J4218_01440 [Candidatus Pacearchaeota archaeon]|nr:hypothetical protein [Candidatus Pacearchaeota archaeon]